ncbi:MAG: lactonase family protein [Planctomycetia bacterium]|nr:lactonase family protein [Planctomycetia bacterium]
MTHRHLQHALCAFLGFSAALSAAPGHAQGGADQTPADKLLVYVGTYTGGKSEGIYCCRLDPATGAIERLGVTADVKNPSFLAIDPAKRFLYAVSEVADADGNTGAVTAFAIERPSGRLTKLNHQSSAGAGPCHLVVDREGKNVLVANYGSGSAAVLPAGPDGRLAHASSKVQHVGTSVNRERQEAPHAHSINLDPGGRYAFVADLGLDKVLVYRFDPAAGKLTANDPPAASVAPGSGPRHFAFHPSGRFAYVINEMASTVTAMKYDPAHGTLTELHTVTTLPPAFWDSNTTAEVQVHPSGRFLYGSNRGHDSIAIFAIDADTGRLSPIGHQPTGGRTPRNFGIDPDGKFLLAANQDSGTIKVFRIDPATGKLAPTGHSIEIPMPVCVKFIKPAG